MKGRLFLSVLFLTFISAQIFPHGNKIHVTGTVEKVSTDSVTVKTRDGKSVEVKLLPATIYVQRARGQDKPAKVADLAAGNFVVIHATPKDSSLEADEVRFSVSTATKPTVPSSRNPHP